MRVNVHRDSDVRMPHEVLQGLGIHSCACLVAAVSVAANMRGDVWHLHPENLIVPFDRMVEAVLPILPRISGLCG